MKHSFTKWRVWALIKDDRNGIEEEMKLIYIQLNYSSNLFAFSPFSFTPTKHNISFSIVECFWQRLWGFKRLYLGWKSCNLMMLKFWWNQTLCSSLSQLSREMDQTFWRWVRWRWVRWLSNASRSSVLIYICLQLIFVFIGKNANRVAHQIVRIPYLTNCHNIFISVGGYFFWSFSMKS